MDLARSPDWRPVDRDDFLAWLRRQLADEPLGMAGGYAAHPVSWYLGARDGGSWVVEVQREQVLLMDRASENRTLHRQDGWLVAFCWELKRPDAYRMVTAADCLLALGNTP